MNYRTAAEANARADDWTRQHDPRRVSFDDRERPVQTWRSFFVSVIVIWIGVLALLKWAAS